MERSHSLYGMSRSSRSTSRTLTESTQESFRFRHQQPRQHYTKRIPVVRNRTWEEMIDNGSYSQQEKPTEEEEEENDEHYHHIDDGHYRQNDKDNHQHYVDTGNNNNNNNNIDDGRNHAYTENNRSANTSVYSQQQQEEEHDDWYEQQESPVFSSTTTVVHDPDLYLSYRDGPETTASSLDRAWVFVQELCAFADRLHKGFSLDRSNFSLVAVDDIVFLADNFLSFQNQLHQQGRPSTVTCAYHYTDSQNLATIRVDGLRSKAEREAAGIQSRGKGAMFGDGIYCASNPIAFRWQGDTGLLVAVLKGAEQSVGHKPPPQPDHVDTYIGNKGDVMPLTSPVDSPFAEIVLKRSQQCLPLFQFQTPEYGFVGAAQEDLFAVHTELQAFLDRFFHHGQSVVLKHRKIPVDNY